MSQAGSNSSGSGAAGALNTLTGNSGGAISPSAGNINIVGDGIGVEVSGNNGTATLTITNLSASFSTKVIDIGPLQNYSTGPTYYATFAHGIIFGPATRIIRSSISNGNVANTVFFPGPYDPYQAGLPGDPLPPTLSSMFTDLVPFYINDTDIVVNVNAQDLSLFTSCYIVIDYIS